jgi:hypothetical protein
MPLDDLPDYSQFTDERLVTVLAKLVADHRRLRDLEFQTRDQLRTTDRQIDDIRRIQAIRKAENHGQVDWGTLLQSDFADHFLSDGRLVTAFKAAGYPFEPVGEFYRDTGQTVIGVKLIRGDQSQIATVQQAIEALVPFLKPCYVRVIAAQMGRGHRVLLHVRENDVLVQDTHGEEKVFKSLPAALRYAQKTYPWAKVGEVPSS